MGGVYNQPQLASPQIPGAQGLPQITPPAQNQFTQNNAAQNLMNPGANQMNAAVLGNLAGGNFNSGQNHAISGGGMMPTNMPMQSPMGMGQMPMRPPMGQMPPMMPGNPMQQPPQSPMMQGMFGMNR